MLPNCSEFVILMLAAAKLGLVMVPQNLSLSPSALAETFADSDVKHIVGWHSVLADLRAEAKNFLAKEDSIWISLGGNTDNCLSFSDIIAKATSSPDLPEVTGEQPYIFCLTSGSTGEPKPIVLLQNTKMERARAAQSLYQVTSEDITLAATPLYHSLAERLVLLPLLTGGTSVIMPTFSASEWLETVEKRQITFSIAVSSQLKQILPEIRKHPEKAKSLRCLVSSSAQLDASLKAELLSYLPCDFHECYGTSEIAIASNLSRHDDRSKITSVGKAAPGVKLAILDETGKQLATEQAGEIACHTPMRFAGYYKRQSLTDAAMWGEYFKTGDLGKIDADGFLYFLGRKKDIIITGGINVYPQDIERVMLQHPLVNECAAIPLPDEQLGEIVGVVIASSDKDSIKVRDLQRLAAKQLADYQQPRRYILVSALPKNQMGKLSKRKLIEKYAESQFD
jgi:acyl-CoA synthetase (AMP-forming)/AMP-acid ligase II